MTNLDDKRNDGLGVVHQSIVTAAFALWSLSLAALTPEPAIAQEISDDWKFAATLYGWLPDIAGNTTFPTDSGSSIDVDFGTILDYLKMAGQGSFNVQHGHWGAYTDLIYLDVGASNSQTRSITIGGAQLPAGVTAATDFDLKTTVWTIGGSYRMVASPAATFDVLAGARLASFKQTLEWQFTGDFGGIEPPPRSGNRDVSIDQWDAIVGVKGRRALGVDHRWSIPYYVDIGTGDSDLTWQGVLGLAYTFGWGDVSVVWRYLDYDLGSGGPITDLSLNGPAIGATFRW